MPTSTDIRKKFLDFFESKAHAIVPSAPIVVKNDPTLMFTNAGMNQFKDMFLGTLAPVDVRVADTQKCLRVSGKHNDLEEVGVDTYHHTMFEMLGNWSFGDYFKEGAIEFAWELLTGIYGIDKDRIYITVFEGDKSDNLSADEESVTFWKKWISADRILYFDRKDNFWEMGDTGPCGPCSEIHVDLRSDEDRRKTPGADLVNMDHPEVIEIWNLVFIQYNRQKGGELVELPSKHVDTGMGFERLCMVLQNKRSSYDTDVFSPMIRKIEELSGVAYGTDIKTDIAIRVVVDHIRAIAFTIADGQLPSNTGAGYVIRRILRRAVRYYYNFLGRNEATLVYLVDILAGQFGDVFPELKTQQSFVHKVVEEEEKSFLRTLESGLGRLDVLLKQHAEVLPGDVVFELYDTYGFPVDLTRLIAGENERTIDEEGFTQALEAQRDRSRKAAASESGDWVIIDEANEVTFTGYEHMEESTRILRHRVITDKKNSYTQVVLETTPFYAESGGQQGDKGYIEADGKRLEVFDTKKENELIVHYVKGTPEIPSSAVTAVVNGKNRQLTCLNHSATHLLHAALKKVLGSHVEQRGSSLNAKHLRFDFSHFSKMSDEEIREVERIVNEKIFEGVVLDEKRNVPKDEAFEMGATALFGEKYGDEVRMIIFDPSYSIELCGGTHVHKTSEIGLFKITHESAIAAGIRRIEAVTGPEAVNYLNARSEILNDVNDALKHPKDTGKAVQSLIDDNAALRKRIEAFEQAQWVSVKDFLKQKSIQVGGVNLIIEKVAGLSGEGMKKVAFDLKNEMESVIALIGSENEGKALLGLVIDEALVAGKDLNAGKLIKTFAAHIRGGGGGQPFFATAGGKDPNGIEAALSEGRDLFKNILHK